MKNLFKKALLLASLFTSFSLLNSNNNSMQTHLNTSELDLPVLKKGLQKQNGPSNVYSYKTVYINSTKFVFTSTNAIWTRKDHINVNITNASTNDTFLIEVTFYQGNSSAITYNDYNEAIVKGSTSYSFTIDSSYYGIAVSYVKVYKKNGSSNYIRKSAFWMNIDYK